MQSAMRRYGGCEFVAGSWLVGGQGVDARTAGLRPIRVHSFRKRNMYERR